MFGDLIEIGFGYNRRRRPSWDSGPVVLRSERLEERDLCAVPGVVISPVNGLGWTNALGSPGHTETGGIGGADDRNAYDMNLNTATTWDADRGAPVYAIADGYIERNLGGGHWAGNGFGQLLLKHVNADGSVYYSGYLHMTNITALKATQGAFVRAGTQIGNVGNVSSFDPNLPYHLHFVLYDWDGTKLRSRTATIQQVTQRPSSTGPANDNFANRASISSGGGTVTGSNVGATAENGEPNPFGASGSHSIWWSWTPAVSGTAVITTTGSNYDSTLGVYVGGAVSSLSRIADNDDANGTVQSQVSFSAVAGTVYAIQVNGWSASTGNVTLNVGISAAQTTPMAPSSVTASPVSSSQVSVSWQDNSSNEQGFRVFRWTGSWTLIGTVGPNVRSFTDSNLQASQTYYYTVSAFNNAGESWAANYATVTTSANTNTAPAAPSNVMWRATSSNTGYLSWYDNSTNELGFRVQYWSGSAWTTFDTMSANATSSRTYGLQRGVYYYLRIVAFNNAGETASNVVSVLM